MSLDATENEETETKLVASDEMELNIAQILDKIESFTQTVSSDEQQTHFDLFVTDDSSHFLLLQVSNLLDTGKTMFKELSNEFEERLIM